MSSVELHRFVHGDGGTHHHFTLSAPTTFSLEMRSGLDAFPPDTRIVLGALLDPAQPEHIAPFVLVEHPIRDGAGWHAAVTQPPQIQRGRLPEETGGDPNPESEEYLPRATDLLRLNELRPLPAELPQPFRLDR